MLALVTQKHKYSVIALSVCVVLVCHIFFTTFKVVFCSCRFVVVFLAVLFRSCCCFCFCFLLCSFCSLSLIMCYFVTVYFCCAVNVVFVVFLGLLWVLLFSLCPPPVIMYVKQ